MAQATQILTSKGLTPRDEITDDDADADGSVVDVDDLGVEMSNEMLKVVPSAVSGPDTGQVASNSAFIDPPSAEQKSAHKTRSRSPSPLTSIPAPPWVIGAGIQPTAQDQQPGSRPAVHPPEAEARNPEEDYKRISNRIKEIVEHAKVMPFVQASLSEILIPEADCTSLWEVLTHSSETGRIPYDQNLDEAVAIALNELASQNFFEKAFNDQTPHSGNVAVLPVMPPSKNTRKRKRDAIEEHNAQMGNDPRRANSKPVSSLQLVHDAIAMASDALRQSEVNRNLISAIQPQLHQVFLFAVTSASGHTASPRMKKTLGEISKLIQLLGILLGVQISASDQSNNIHIPVDPSLEAESSSGRKPSPVDESESRKSTQLRALVFPCSHGNCLKTFTKMHDLRIHQRIHTKDRPFKCNTCPASFIRSHDLHRHARGHLNKVFQCRSCERTFSRKDAFKRHKENARNAPTCSRAQFDVVDAPEKKTISFWAKLNVGMSGELEEGELSPEALTAALDEMTHFHRILHICVGNYLHSRTLSGEFTNQPPPLPPPPITIIPGIHSVDGPMEVDMVTLGLGATDFLGQPLTDIIDPFVELFPSIDLAEAGISIKHLREVQLLVEQSKEAALTQAEQEARIAEGLSSYEHDDFFND